MKRVIIVGMGFGGIRAARELAGCQSGGEGDILLCVHAIM